MRNVLLGLAAIAIMVFSVTRASALVIYDESVGGDLDAIGSTNVNLVAGVNTIIGAIDATPPAETDRIKFTQISGLVVDSIILSFTAPFDDARIGQNMSTALFNNVDNLFDDNFNYIASDGLTTVASFYDSSFNFISSGDSISASFFDSFGAETGALSTTTAGAIWDFQLSAGTVWPSQPWTLTINTSASAIPEPATMVLFGTGLAGLACYRRKQKK